jgi:hypothetical protein
MHSEFTPEQLIDLYEVPSEANYEAVFESFQRTTREPLSWKDPGDDAEFITQLQIGEVPNSGRLVIVFSKWANLCYADIPAKPVVAVEPHQGQSASTRPSKALESKNVYNERRTSIKGIRAFCRLFRNVHKCTFFNVRGSQGAD